MEILASWSWHYGDPHSSWFSWLHARDTEQTQLPFGWHMLTAPQQEVNVYTILTKNIKPWIETTYLEPA